MPGSFQGAKVGACTDCRGNWAKFRAGAIDIEDISALNEELAPTVSRHILFTSPFQESCCSFDRPPSVLISFYNRPALAVLWERQAPWHVFSSPSA
jgi:hypothetical protein